MCLHLTTTEPIIANEDIVCYKVAIPFGEKYYELNWRNKIVSKINKGNMFYTPYRNKVIKVGHTYKIKRNWFKRNKTQFYTDSKGFTLNEGVFHTFAYYEDARDDAWMYNEASVIKAIIPKGTEYYVGKFSGTKSYGSKQIKYVEKLF